MYDDIVMFPVVDRWRVDGLLPKVNRDEAYMKYTIQKLEPYYFCKRPPGAAGALIITAQHIIYGYVGPPSGSPNCLEAGCDMVDGHCIRTIHAERRAIHNAARYGLRVMNATIYSILKPCFECSKAIIASGISRVVYAGAAYDEERTRAILENAGVSCVHIGVDLSYGQDLVR